MFATEFVVRWRISEVPQRFSEVLLVEDELDVGRGVRQALLLQRLPQLRRATQEHADL